MQTFEDIWQKDSNRLEGEHVSKGYLPAETLYGAVDRGCIAANVSHVPDQRSDNLDE